MTSQIVGQIRNRYLLQLKKHITIKQIIHPKYGYATEANSNENIPKEESKTFRQKARDTWNGPNFKYWVIGATGFFGWMGYYGMKNYKNKCLDIEIFPPMPNHVLVKREIELNELYEKHKNQMSLLDRNNMKKLLILGVPGTGKTVLVKEFIELLKSKQNNNYSLPKSNINIFLQADTESSFLISLKAFAAKLKIKQSDLNEKLQASEDFHLLAFNEQCNILLECIQESLAKHPGWVITIDSIQQITSPNIHALIKYWFLENQASWSSGTLILVNEGVNDNFVNVGKQTRYQMKKGLNTDDGISFIKQIVNLEDKTASSKPIIQLLERVYFNPLGVLCVGILLRDILKQKQTMSVKDAVDVVLTELETNVKQVLNDNSHLNDYVKTYSGFKLLSIETVISMAMKLILQDNIFLHHGFDMIASLKPSTSSSQSLLTRHFMDPFYKLPKIAEKSIGLLEAFTQSNTDIDVKKNKDEDLEPKGKLWSNKNLTEYVKKVEDFFITGWTTVKDVYNIFYGDLPPLPPRSDGLDMFRSCELLLTGIIEPGDAKDVSMHPLVYNVARQHFTSFTIYDLEQKHLQSSREKYDVQSWYRKFSGFSDQACLHKFRTSGTSNNNNNTPITDSSTKNAVVEVKNPQDYIFRYNLGINISSVFNKSFIPINKEEFWLPKDIDQFHYLQNHLSRVISSICGEIKVSKENVAGRSIKENSLQHLEYILNNQPAELIPSAKRIEALITVSKCYAKLYSKTNESKEILENVLQLQRSNATTNQLDIAKTMSSLAEIYNHLDDFETAKQLLEEAGEIYEKDRRKNGEYKRSLEFGKLLGLLGVVYGSLSMKIESKETIERSLMLLQAAPPDLNDEAMSKQYGGEFASALTDLGHSYVSLGLPLYGKKILDLALSAHRNIHGENHSEVVRTLTILGIAHLMQGHNEESKRLRTEAGKLQATISAIPNY